MSHSTWFFITEMNVTNQVKRGKHIANQKWKQIQCPNLTIVNLTIKEILFLKNHKSCL